MKNYKCIKILFIALMCMFSLDIFAAPPSENVAVSFSLFQELYDKLPSEIVNYLKRKGCIIKNGAQHELYSEVRGGIIKIYTSNYNKNRIGIGPLEFITPDSQVKKAWYRGLTKSEYKQGVNGIWKGKFDVLPVFGINEVRVSMPNGVNQTASVLYLAAYSQMDHSAQVGPTEYKGSIGKYKITMQLDTPYEDDTGNNIVTGVYWYGSGKNGKMTLKGELTYDSNMHRTYRLDEYDPNGRKCGSFILIEGYNASTRVSFLDGCMTNKAGTSYYVYLKEE